MLQLAGLEASVLKITADALTGVSVAPSDALPCDLHVARLGWVQFKVRTMNRALADLLAKQEIFELLASYCRGVDRCDEELVRSVYHDDATDDHNYWRGLGHDFAGYICQRLREANSATTHALSNVLITVDGDQAVSESQVLATLVRRDEGVVDLFGGRYLDRLKRVDGRWRISARQALIDWFYSNRLGLVESPIPLEGATWGGRHPHDPIYQLAL